MKLRGTRSIDPRGSTQVAPDGSVAAVALGLVSRIDETLRRFSGRDLVAASDVVDLLLDLRSYATLADLFDSWE